MRNFGTYLPIWKHWTAASVKHDCNVVTYRLIFISGMQFNVALIIQLTRSVQTAERCKLACPYVHCIYFSIHKTNGNK